MTSTIAGSSSMMMILAMFRGGDYFTREKRKGKYENDTVSGLGAGLPADPAANAPGSSHAMICA